MAVMFSVIFYTVLAVAAFYFILLQPVLKQQRNRKKAVQELMVGDEVVTTGGIIALVIDVVTPADGPTELILEISEGVRVRAMTDAVDRRLTTLEPVPEDEADPAFLEGSADPHA
jgi:preprotein translocase subunit YajC